MADPLDWIAEETGDSAVAAGIVTGAAIAFGIIGMFEALRQNPRTPLVVERSYWTSEIDGRRLYDCACPGCGTQMKGRTAGVDEGTSNEWCGLCRYGE